jgi:hypothetical protein
LKQFGFELITCLFREYSVLLLLKWGPGLAKDVCHVEGAKRNVMKSNQSAQPASETV